jgi:hypothetical protein
MKLDFTYTLEFEVQRVKGTIEKGDWFKQFNYKLFFPRGFGLDSKEFSRLESQVKKEFTPAKMKKIEKNISNRWAKNGQHIESFLKSVPYKVPSSLVVIFTRYGVGGSYWLPNKVILNVSYDLDYFETVMHELVHLLIEKPVVQEYELSHESKEALIDYICSHNKHLKRMLPDYPVQKMFASKLPDKRLMSKLNWI